MMDVERAFRFGRAGHLVGIAGLPPAAQDVGVIVLNAGLVHRIGPFRLHVELTRRLNACGYPSVRFDLSTLGDSGASSASESRVQQVRADIADAMTLLREQAGCTRFVLVGLCSGAENAHRAAATEAGVAGAIFLDGYAYRTVGFEVRRYLPLLLNPARVGRLLARRLRVSGWPAAAPSFSVAHPPRRQVRDELADMLDRGLKLYFIYSGGTNRYLNHRRQFRECFGRLAVHPGVEVERLEETDHTYILTGDRDMLLGRIEQWMDRHFPLSSRPSP
ncbi:MAG: alpha/beta fold hydrolase [Rhodanobacter sp.]